MPAGPTEVLERRPAAPSSRRDRLRRRAAPLVGAAVVAFIAGVIAGAAHGPDIHALITRYVGAWERGDYAAMYRMLDSRSRATISEPRFAAALAAAADTATLRSIALRRIGAERGGVVSVALTARTAVFGTLREPLLVGVDTAGPQPQIVYGPALLFPGLLPGERLTRTVQLPPRAALLARDGTPLAEGPTRSSPIPAIASEVVGTLGAIPADEAPIFAREGYPADARVGLDGLERIFESRLVGRPGGTLLAGSRVLARAQPQAAPAVTTTIDPTLEAAAIAALGGRYGGIVAMDPRTGGLLALAGIAFSDVQPPGSTMKIITTTAALQARIVKLGDSFPIATSATIDGYTLKNANGEACGGTLLNAFAVSCNSVFAPLGVRVGAQRLVATAIRYGFDQPSSIPGALESQIPSAATIGSALSVASSAIGQGMVEASPLEMTDVAATIAMGGRRPIPTLLAHQRPRFARVTSHRVAGLLQRMMVAVVQYGTGTAAQIPGVEVAGKTGTAELTNTSNPNDPNANSASNTDAWFVAYAPVGAPRIAVGALFPNQGAGGGTAAPAAREVLVAGLARGG